ncbi:MAG: DUF3048 domain-containing protein [Micropruina sp.]
MDGVSRRTALLGMLAAAGTGLAACTAPVTAPSTGSTSAAPGVPASPTPTLDTRPRWPLTGKLLKDESAAKHAAVAVKVPDNRNEHPQVGLDKADIVFVQLDGYRDAAGYSGTRLMPLFHSRMPNDVGPVRSIRPVDVPLLSPVHAVIGNTGATGWVLNYVEAFSDDLVSELSYMATKGTGSYSIDPTRVRTYQGVTYFDRAVVCHPKVLARQTTKFRKGPPVSYFPFATAADEVSTASGKRARTVGVPWKPGDTYNMTYTYNAGSGRYLRSMPWGSHVLRNGTRIATDNVLVIRAKQRYAKIFSGSGGQEPVHEIIDTQGSFHYFHGGKYVTGTWAKGAAADQFSFTLADGSPLKMAPGQTYVELPQHNAKLRILA